MQQLQANAEEKDIAIQKILSEKRECVRKCDLLEEQNRQLQEQLSLLDKENLQSQKATVNMQLILEAQNMTQRKA